MSVRARQTAFGEVYRPLPYPQSARLLPRLACALRVPLFVHFAQAAQAPPVLALRSKNDVSKIVQICAVSCNYTGQKKRPIGPHFCYCCWGGRLSLFLGTKLGDSAAEPTLSDSSFALNCEYVSVSKNEIPSISSLGTSVLKSARVT